MPATTTHTPPRHYHRGKSAASSLCGGVGVFAAPFSAAVFAWTELAFLRMVQHGAAMGEAAKGSSAAAPMFVSMVEAGFKTQV